MSVKLRKRKTKSPGGKLAAAVALGRRGGVKGGPARAKVLTPSERSSIASMGARAKNAGKSGRKKNVHGTYGSGGKKTSR
jgi:hypothetical protein